MAGASGKKLDETYKLAWLRGLKTTYYLRTMAPRREVHLLPAHHGTPATVTSSSARSTTPTAKPANEAMRTQRTALTRCRATTGRQCQEVLGV
jgi:hypothetical protein